ncbi:hypothetical protein SDC9_174295 [bioreactor metagenome]|uniref:Uncharacterized protein n=1 Tax=bioreactor metagenome TaxID=1076179 RepID=A0A645GLX3_9ZZZZ
MRARAVCAFTMQDNIELARLRHHRPAAYGHLALRYARPQMKPEYALNRRVFKRSLFDHARCTANGLLGRLEKQHDIVFECFAVSVHERSEQQ